jgi:hypothetical protein
MSIETTGNKIVEQILESPAAIEALAKLGINLQQDAEAHARDKALQAKAKLEGSQNIQWEIARKRDHQRQCKHKNVVLIQPTPHPDYLLCLKCQAIIRPGLAPAGYNGGDIYDTALFEQLQKREPDPLFPMVMQAVDADRNRYHMLWEEEAEALSDDELRKRADKELLRWEEYKARTTKPSK